MRIGQKANPFKLPETLRAIGPDSKVVWIMGILRAVLLICLWQAAALLPASEVTIGAGEQRARLPINFLYYSSLYQCLYYPEELGFASATIDSIAFYNDFTNSPSNGATQIWMGSTGLQHLSEGMIPSSQLTMVFDGVVNYPEGTNTIRIALQTPYEHSPGNLVLMVLRPYEPHWYPGIQLFQCSSSYQPRARMVRQDSYIDTIEPPLGDLTMQFPRTTFYYQSTPVDHDLACNRLSGPEMPSAGEVALYQAVVINNGQIPQSAYSVKLYNSQDVELACLTGSGIQPLQSLSHTFSWIPDTSGPQTLYARVFLAGDAIPANDQSDPIPISVLPEGVQAITIGTGDMNNRMPVDFSYLTSLCETIYYPDELGFGSATVTGIAFYNRFAESFAAEPICIWMGSTNLSDLSAGWIPSPNLEMVFNGVVDFPAGQNRIVIPLQNPFNHYFGNLVTLIHRPYSTTSSHLWDVFRCQNWPQNRTRMRSDSSVIDPANPPFGNLLSIFPKTTFFHTELSISTDIAALSISGNPMPSVGVASTYRITIVNQGSSTQNNVQVNLIKEGGAVLGSVTIGSLGPSHMQECIVEWVPNAPGPTNLYGMVLLTGDAVPENDITPALAVAVQAQGYIAVTVGNGGSTDRMPVDMYYRSSIFETIYLASDLNFTGEIARLQFYNSFTEDIPGRHTRIWLGETTLSNLESQWIPSTQLTLVFDGNIDYPVGNNAILIPLDTHYSYGGANLVLMVQRPRDALSYSSSNKFITQAAPSSFQSRIMSSDTMNFDPANPSGSWFPSPMYPKTTFIFLTLSEGSDPENHAPSVSTLGKARPNPFRHTSGTRIDVDLIPGETGILGIYNISGRLIKRYQLTQGPQQITWNGRDRDNGLCASGVYLYRLETPSRKLTGKMVLTH